MATKDKVWTFNGSMQTIHSYYYSHLENGWYEEDATPISKGSKITSATLLFILDSYSPSVPSMELYVLDKYNSRATRGVYANFSDDGTIKWATIDLLHPGNDHAPLELFFDSINVESGIGTTTSDISGNPSFALKTVNEGYMFSTNPIVLSVTYEEPIASLDPPNSLTCNYANNHNSFRFELQYPSSLTWQQNFDIVEIQYSVLPPYGSTWGVWQTIDKIIVNEPYQYDFEYWHVAVNSRIQFRARVGDSSTGAYSNYTSGNMEFTIVKTPPAAPVATIDSEEHGQLDTITLSWTCQGDPNDYPLHYEMKYRYKKRASDSWSSWNQYTVWNGSAMVPPTITGNTLSFTPKIRLCPNVQPIFWYWSYRFEFRIVAVVETELDTLTTDSNLVKSMVNRQNIVCPHAGGVSYCRTPYVRYVVPSTDSVYSQPNSLLFRVGNLRTGTWQPWVQVDTTELTDKYAILRNSPYDLDTDPDCAIQFQIDDYYPYEPMRLYYVAPQYTRTISSGDVIANQSISHVQDLNEMLAMVNVLRQTDNKTAISFTDPPGYFANWQSNMWQMLDSMTRMRSALHGEVETGYPIDRVPKYPTAATVNLLRGMIEGEDI